MKNPRIIRSLLHYKELKRKLDDLKFDLNKDLMPLHIEDEGITEYNQSIEKVEGLIEDIIEKLTIMGEDE